MKTLKDFKIWQPFYHSIAREIKLVGNPSPDMIDELDGSRLVDSRSLRKEAIKWIKEIREHRRDLFINGRIFENDSISTKFNINFSLDQDWIKHFFNINEEELK